MAEERELWGFGADDVNLVLSPMHHSAPLRFASARCSRVGGSWCPGRVRPGPRDRRDPRASDPRRCSASRPISSGCSRTGSEHGEPDLSCFRLVAHAGAPCPEWVKRRLIERFPAGSTWEFYGSTEGQFTACRSEEWLEHPGTLGRARPGRTMTVDEDGQLWCVVPPHARFSYFGDPEKTAEAWRETAGRAGLHRGRPRPDRRGRPRLPRRPSRGPDHLRRGQRLPGGGGAGAGRGRRGRRHRGVRRRRRGVGPARVRGGGRGRRRRPRWRRTPASTWRRPSGRRSTTDSASSPGPRPARCAGSTCRTCCRTVGDGVLQGRAGGVPRRRGARPAPGPGSDLRLLFVGINPGLWTAAVQTHFAHPGNRFYPALLRAGILDRPRRPVVGDDRRGPRPPSPLAGSASPTSRHVPPPGPPSCPPPSCGRAVSGCALWSASATPRVVAVAGITAYRQAFGQPKAVLGPQPEPFEGAELWVVPNPSGLNAHETSRPWPRRTPRPPGPPGSCRQA